MSQTVNKPTLTQKTGLPPPPPSKNNNLPPPPPPVNRNTSSKEERMKEFEKTQDRALQ